MVRDLQMMKDITPLFEKKIVIWGMGHRGKMFLEEIISMGAGKKGILLCDSDCKHWGEMVGSQNRILSPGELQGSLMKDDLGNVIILVIVLSTRAQDEILDSIRHLYGDEAEIYTDYAVDMGICLNLNHPDINREYRERKLLEREKKRLLNPYAESREEVLRYFAFLPLYQDEAIVVYQCGKVGSSSVYRSIEQHGRYALHCHRFTDVGKNEDDLYRLLNLRSGKIICMVRDPVAVTIASMWQNLKSSWERSTKEVNFSQIESGYLDNGKLNSEFRWFDEQMKRFLRIDVFQHSFDREKGYSIIENGNIELLLIKLEKMDELEDVIGAFLNIKQFRLCRDNIAAEKPYRFAYREYKEGLRIPRERLEEVYQMDDRMKHFYTEQERNALYIKWNKS